MVSLDFLFLKFVTMGFTFLTLRWFQKYREQSGILLDEVVVVSLSLSPCQQFICNLEVPTSPDTGNVSFNHWDGIRGQLNLLPHPSAKGIHSFYSIHFCMTGSNGKEHLTVSQPAIRNQTGKTEFQAIINSKQTNKIPTMGSMDSKYGNEFLMNWKYCYGILSHQCGD